jgi:hypothetical protein
VRRDIKAEGGGREAEGRGIEKRRDEGWRSRGRRYREAEGRGMEKQREEG